MSTKKKFYWYTWGREPWGQFDTVKAAKEHASSKIGADNPAVVYVFELASVGRIPPEPARVWADE